MKLVRCDICKKAFPEGYASKIIFKEGSRREIVVKYSNGEWCNVDEFEVDICRECAYPILKTLKPRSEFLPLEEYNDD